MAKAVAEAAIKNGVARNNADIHEVEENIRNYVLERKLRNFD